jgi:hypothetical protein
MKLSKLLGLRKHPHRLAVDLDVEMRLGPSAVCGVVVLLLVGNSLRLIMEWVLNRV